MSELVVKTIDVADIAIDHTARAAQATVCVSFAFTPELAETHTCRVNVEAKFARDVPRERYLHRSRNIALRKVTDYFAGKDLFETNIFAT